MTFTVLTVVLSGTMSSPAAISLSDLTAGGAVSSATKLSGVLDVALPANGDSAFTLTSSVSAIRQNRENQTVLRTMASACGS